MNKYQEFRGKHQRLALLQVLSQAPEYGHSETVLQAALRELQLSASRDRLRVLLDWLAEMELVRLSEVRGMQEVRLTARGDDVARGLSRVRGVARVQELLD